MPFQLPAPLLWQGRIIKKRQIFTELRLDTFKAIVFGKTLAGDFATSFRHGSSFAIEAAEPERLFDHLC
jgi:hypothetical protein